MKRESFINQVPQKKAWDNYLTAEDRVHIAVIKYLRAQYPLCFFIHPPNEGKRSKFEIWKAQQLGLTRGVPDLLIFDGPGLALELKAGKNKATPSQRNMLQAFKNRGWEAEIATGFDQAKKIIDSYFHRLRNHFFEQPPINWVKGQPWPFKGPNKPLGQ